MVSASREGVMTEQQGPATQVLPSEQLERVEIANVARPGPERELYLILYPQELEEEIIQKLEACGVPGYTEFPKLVGRGPHHRRFDDQIWPGATGGVFTVIDPAHADCFLPAFQELNELLGERSHGVHGL